ncbi:6616_t:CDS:2, partial [Funneliformis mosseae]
MNWYSSNNAWHGAKKRHVAGSAATEVEIIANYKRKTGGEEQVSRGWYLGQVPRPTPLSERSDRQGPSPHADIMKTSSNHQ